MVRVRSFMVLSGISLAVSLSAIVNCGSSTTSVTGSSTSTTTSSSGSTSSGASYTSAEPPAPGPTNAGGGAGITFAVSQLFLGDTPACTPAAGSATCAPGASSSMAGYWKAFGYDLDHQNDTATTTNHCKPVNGVALKTLANGNDGIDNSFGENILGILVDLSSTASEKINQDIQAGKFTIMFQVGGLGTGAEYTGLNTSLFAGANLTGADGGLETPQFNGTDNWPVSPSLLNGTTIASGSKVTFPTAYVVGNTWVSGAQPGTVTLQLAISSVMLNLTITQARVSFQMNAAHTYASNGIIAGVLNTQALTTQIQQLAGTFDPSFCSGTAVQGILDEIAQASDIGADGTQNPAETCNGISIGLGFNGALVENPSIVGPAPVATPNPCNSTSSASSSSGASGSSSSGGTGGGDAG